MENLLNDFLGSLFSAINEFLNGVFGWLSAFFGGFNFDL
jgi:hypothetical protein